MRKIEEEVLSNLIKEYYRNQLSRFRKGDGITKAWSIDFIKYLIENKSPLDLSIFPEEDHEEIEKFLQAKIRFAFEDFEWGSEKGDINDKTTYGTSLIKEFPKLENTNFINVGAYDGDSCITLNKLLPNKIYAFEPNSKLFKKIKKKKIENVIPIKKAITDKDGVIGFTKYDKGSFCEDIGPESRGVAESLTLDSFIYGNNIKVSLVKIDTEGYELEVIKGASKTIKNIKPIFIVALYHKAKDFYEIPKILYQNGYKLRFINLNPKQPIAEKFLIALPKLKWKNK